MKIERSNSSSGNWIIWDGNTPYYFMRKSEALAWLTKRQGVNYVAE